MYRISSHCFIHYFHILFLAEANENFIAWRYVEVDVPKYTRYLTFLAVRGGSTAAEDEGDIAIDNIDYSQGRCGALLLIVLYLKYTNGNNTSIS